jgi:hypothetical protein
LGSGQKGRCKQQKMRTGIIHQVVLKRLSTRGPGANSIKHFTDVINGIS